MAYEITRSFDILSQKYRVFIIRGGVQETASWRNNILTSGEQPMSKESSNDGVLIRVLELYGKPVDDVNVAHTLHLVSENHYGFA